MSAKNKDDALEKATRLNTKFKLAAASIGSGVGVAMCSSTVLGFVPSAAFIALGIRWAGKGNAKKLSTFESVGAIVSGSAVGVLLAHGMGLVDVIEYDFANNVLEQGSAYAQPAEERVAMNTNEIIVPKLAA